MTGPVVVMSGGVGGAKLIEGVYYLANRPGLIAVVNTADDFEHLGLHISPDIDSVLYAVAGLSDRKRGWGRAGESWQFMRALNELGGPGWFRLGDLDLAMHVLRTHTLRQGATLSQVVAAQTQALGLDLALLPMSDQRVTTIVDTDEGPLEFQRYFVERRCEPALGGLRFAGASMAKPAPGVLAALARASAIVIAPSNPFLSIDPILAVPGIRAALRAVPAPVIAISPLIGGQSIKGPTSKIMAELGLAASNESIIAHYDGLIDGIVTDRIDPIPATLISAQTDTMMRTLDDKCRVARQALDLAGRLAR